MVVALGRLGSWVFLKNRQLVLHVEEVKDASSEQAQDKEVNEEEDGQLFVVVKELDGVHDELRRRHGFGGIWNSND